MSRRQWALAALVVAGLMMATSLASAAPAEGATAPAEGGGFSKTVGLALAAAFVAGVSIAAAGYAVGRVGSAAIGAVAEKPELMGRTILFVALAEGLGVLGFALAIVMLYAL